MHMCVFVSNEPHFPHTCLLRITKITQQLFKLSAVGGLSGAQCFRHTYISLQQQTTIYSIHIVSSKHQSHIAVRL